MRVLINKKNVRFESLTLDLRFNSIASTFNMLAVNLFIEPFSFPDIEIYSDNNELLFTGICFAPDMSDYIIPTDYRYFGYSKTGILEDSSIAKESYPLQFDNLTLIDITEKLLKPFSIKYTYSSNVQTDLNKKFEKTSAYPGTSIRQYLNSLASQRNIYLTHNEKGELVYTRFDKSRNLTTGKYEVGLPGIKSAELNINYQSLHSDITVMKQATKLNPDSAESTIKNPYMPIYKPMTIVSNSGDIFDVDKAAKAALASELSNIKFVIQGTKFHKPGTTIELKSEKLRLSKSTELFVEQVLYTQSAENSDQITLNCVLPEVYTGAVPKNIFS